MFDASVFVVIFVSCVDISITVALAIYFYCTASKRPGLSSSQLDKLPKVTGKDLVLGTTCAVCLDEIENDQIVRMIPGCNHGFHLQCVDEWLHRNAACPICRTEIGPEFFDAAEVNPC